MATPKRSYDQQQQLQIVQHVKNSGMINNIQSPRRDEKEEEMSRSVLAMFREKEEEIERRKLEVRDKVHAHLGRVEKETKRLAEIREVSPINKHWIWARLFIMFHCLFGFYAFINLCAKFQNHGRGHAVIFDIVENHG